MKFDHGFKHFVLGLVAGAALAEGFYLHRAWEYYGAGAIVLAFYFVREIYWSAKS